MTPVLADHTACTGADPTLVEAMQMIVKMLGELSWNHRMGEWVCSAPTGRISERSTTQAPGHFWAHGLDPVDTVRRVYEQWVDAGRPTYPHVAD
jgi:hypothetical protein